MVADQPPVYLRVAAHHASRWVSPPIRKPHDVAIQSIQVNGVDLLYGDTRKDDAFMYGEGMVIRIHAPAKGRWTLEASSAKTVPATVKVRYRLKYRNLTKRS